jgi:cytochrome b pre-mRNA-processing protein 3
VDAPLPLSAPLSIAHARAYLPAMSILSSLFTKKPDPRAVMRPLYDAIVARGRNPDWYLAGVPDTQDGRFEVIASVVALVLLRLEREAGQDQNSVWLTETFIDDMDGQLRSIGVGDFVVGKHVGKMMAALGGRLTALRDAGDDAALVRAAVVRNIWDGEDPGAPADAAAAMLVRLRADLAGTDLDAILAARLPFVVRP